MGLDYLIPNPNKKLTENLVLQFTERASKEADENPSSETENTLNVLRDSGDTPIRFLSQLKTKKQAKSRREKKLFLVKHLRLL